MILPTGVELHNKPGNRRLLINRRSGIRENAHHVGHNRALVNYTLLCALILSPFEASANSPLVIS